MKRRIVLVVFAALALVVAGCGGSDSGEASTEAWANDVCSAISDWTAALTATTSALANPSDLSVSSFKETVNGLADATETFVDDVRGLGRPETDAGQQAQEELTQLSDQLRTEADELRTELESGANSLTALLGKVSALTGTLSAMSNAVGTTFDDISNLDGADELESAFESAENCESLGSTR